MSSVEPGNSQSAANATSPRGARIDPATLMRIKNLEMRAQIVVDGFMNGLHRSPFHGFSSEFSEYRQYTRGDDPKHIDWKLYARSDRHFIKRFEDETNLRCNLLVDRSHSMGYGSRDYTKSDYAQTLAATLAYFLTKQRDAVGVMTFDEAVGSYLPARYRPGHFHRILGCLEAPLQGKATDLVAPIEQIAQLVRKRGMIVLISDLLAKIEHLENSLACLRSLGHEVVVMRVLDPAEVDFAFDTPAMFEDVETGRDVYIDPDQVRRSYQARFQQHAESVADMCRQQGVHLCSLTTDQPLQDGLFDFLQSRRERRQVLRRQGNPGRGA